MIKKKTKYHAIHQLILSLLCLVPYSRGLLEHLLISGIQDQVIDWARQGFSFKTENIVPVGNNVINNIINLSINVSQETFHSLIFQCLMLTSPPCVCVGPCLTHLSLRGVIVTDDSLASESREMLCCCVVQLDKFNTPRHTITPSDQAKIYLVSPLSSLTGGSCNSLPLKTPLSVLFILKSL